MTIKKSESVALYDVCQIAGSTGTCTYAGVVVRVTGTAVLARSLPTGAIVPAPFDELSAPNTSDTFMVTERDPPPVVPMAKVSDDTPKAVAPPTAGAVKPHAAALDPMPRAVPVGMALVRFRVESVHDDGAAPTAGGAGEVAEVVAMRRKEQRAAGVLQVFPSAE